jgi:DNA-binding transcriptional ArsR family regulator
MAMEPDPSGTAPAFAEAPAGGAPVAEAPVDTAPVDTAPVDVVPVDEAASLAAAACLFRGLGDPTRLAILRHLALGEHKVVELTAQLGMAQSTVSGHLVCLRGCGLVESRPQGRASLFSLTARPELLGLLGAAERLLAATGDQVALCPLSGTGDR